ncbi:AraC family transcriptional regulator [Aquimarina sp. AD1]|uniref:helix-turn-helix domain-containing protein n=2 Tax=Aquimarina sp. (strain AD1) TaxID=1714848 RepID=UPI000E4F0477|nr:AraC family transcriptional regulator [Aquimarina sp. AD1]AXT57538.1 AraC family transcriptional regulator [Aquimarina sp. AD1]
MGQDFILEKATILAFFIALVLALFLFTVKSKRHNKVSNMLMGLFLLILAIHISVFLYSDYIRTPLIFEQLRDQFMLFSGPLLYLYLISSMYLDFKLNKGHLLHIIPFVLVIIIFIPRFFSVSETDRMVFYQSYHSHLEAKLYAFLNMVTISFYLILMCVELKKYKLILLENYSDKRYFNYKWLNQLTFLLVLLFIFSFFRTAIIYFGNHEEILNIRIFHTIYLVLFVSWLILKSLYSPEIFRAVDTKHKLVKNLYLNNSQNINLNQVSDQKEIQEKIVKLRQHIEINQSFLNSTLSIKELANSVGMETQELSILINRYIGKHFFDFINEYRIEMAIKILEDPNRRSSHVLEILYEVGFNSKSSFHRAFRKYTRKTPKDYRAKS